MTGMIYWYNFKTGIYDEIVRPSPDNVRDYIPQDGTVQNIFTCYFEISKDYMMALQKTLEAVAKSYRPDGKEQS